MAKVYNSRWEAKPLTDEDIMEFKNGDKILQHLLEKNYSGIVLQW